MSDLHTQRHTLNCSDELSERIKAKVRDAKFASVSAYLAYLVERDLDQGATHCDTCVDRRAAEMIGGALKLLSQKPPAM